MGIFFVSLIAGLFFFREAILWKLGAILVISEVPQKADMAEVLGGDYRGNRILKACELVRQGFVPQAAVTGAGGFYGVHESRLSIDFAATRGCPPGFFMPSDYPALSTTDELENLVPELRRRGCISCWWSPVPAIPDAPPGFSIALHRT